MFRLFVSSFMTMTCIGAAQAQSTQCYVRIGANSAQYEGKCPNSNLKWETFENQSGAFGRNCQDEPWTFDRAKRSYTNNRTKVSLPMTDCAAQR
ncbi:hypothetical protein AB4Y85_13405 [Microvirga sp. 2YAF29]|uniref:hypothetical protein n=1 Tax=Microvirga sp. 2YAF29 TaxID=3233031 RepID=UPI003F98AD4B